MSSESKRLRLEPGNGSPIKEYRIENGIVEARTLDPNGQPDPQTGGDWEQLTPDQLAVHVERNTVVAQWLQRRLGWRRLLWACMSQEPSLPEVSEESNQAAF
jgi:hypothetical protein